VVGELGGVDPDKVELALVLARDGLDGLDGRLAVLVLGLDKDVGERQAGLGVRGKVLGRDLVEEGRGVLADEVAERVGLDGAGKVVAALVEGLVEDDSGRGDLGGGDGGRVGREAEEVLVAVLLGEGLVRGPAGRVRLVEVGNEDDPVGLLEVGVVFGRDYRDGGQRLPARVSFPPATRVERKLTSSCS
jgi:hypothetical protein